MRPVLRYKPDTTMGSATPPEAITPDAWVWYGSTGSSSTTHITLPSAPEDDHMTVYEYIVVYTGDENYEGAKVLVGPTISLGVDEDVVRMEAARKIPAAFANKLDDIDIIVRKWAA